MAFTPDMVAASHRHMHAADILDESTSRGVAGYLYGLAAECAIKAMMQEAGIRALPLGDRREDPYYAHFPSLRTMLRESLQGRTTTILRRFVDDDGFFSHWDIQMRYSKGSEISPDWVSRWKEQAHQAVSSVGS